MSIQAVGAVMASGLLTGSKYCICLSIANHADADGYAYPSLTTIAFEARCDRSTVKRNMLSLTRADFFTKCGSGTSPVGTNLYRLNVEKFETEAKRLSALRRQFNALQNAGGLGAPRAHPRGWAKVGASDAPGLGAPDAPKGGASGEPLIIHNHHIILKETIAGISEPLPAVVNMADWLLWRRAKVRAHPSDAGLIRSITITNGVAQVPTDRQLRELVRRFGGELAALGVQALQSKDSHRWAYVDDQQPEAASRRAGQ